MNDATSTLLLLRQAVAEAAAAEAAAAAAAVSVLSAASREGSNSAAVEMLLVVIVCLYSTHSALYLAAQSNAAGINTYKKKDKTIIVYSGPESSGSRSAIPAANRAAEGAVGLCCRPFAYTTHTAV